MNRGFMLDSLSQFSLRPMALEDLREILKIEKDAYPSPWTEEHFLLEMEKPFAHVLVLTDDETDAIVAGYIVFWLLFEECHILNLAVHPAWRQQGAAAKLVRAAVAQSLKKGFKRVFLEARKSNSAAVKLYQKLGFFIDHVKSRFYSDGEDAYFLTLYLDRKNQF